MHSKVVLVTGRVQIPVVVNAVAEVLAINSMVLEVVDSSDALGSLGLVKESGEPPPLAYSYPAPADSFYREPTRIRKVALSPAKRLLQKRQSLQKS